MKNPTKISLHHRYTRAISSLQHGETLKNVPEKRANMFSRDFSFLPLFFLFILVYFRLLLNGPRSSYIFLFFWGVLEAPLTARVRVCILRNSKIYRTRTENNTRKFFFTSLSLFSPFYTLKQSTSPRVHGTFRNASAENFFKLLLILAFLISLARVSESRDIRSYGTMQAREKCFAIYKH